MSTESERFLSVSESDSQSKAEYSRRYPAMRFIAGFNKFLAIVMGIAALFSFFIGIIVISDEVVKREVMGGKGILLMAGGVFLGLFGVLVHLAYAESILVVLDIEENTRNAYLCFRDRLKPSGRPQSSLGPEPEQNGDLAQSTSDYIFFNCPHCGQSIDAEKSCSGMLINCPGCDKRIAVP